MNGSRANLPRPTAGRLAACLALALAGCALPSNASLTLPARNRVVREQLVVHSDFALAANHRLLEELTARRSDLQEALGLPASDEPIHVYLFETQEQFAQFMRAHHPRFPNRRAFFLETDTRLQVYAQWGDRVAEDLRHEVTHGYLHAVVPSIPLWLDEGLAEFSEAPRGTGGLVPGHVAQLAARLDRGDWRPDLARLERIDPARDMTQDDYAESWAWVHFLLETAPQHRALLRAYFADLRREGNSWPVSLRLKRLLPQPEEALIEHVRQLAAAVR